MTPTAMRWFGLTAPQPESCHRLAWFLYGCIEREHALNMLACTDWWLRVVTASSGGFKFPAAVAAAPEGKTP